MYGKRILWINTVKDLQYEIKCENSVKDKDNFLLSITFLFFFKKFFFFILGDIFFKIPKNLI